MPASASGGVYIEADCFQILHLERGFIEPVQIFTINFKYTAPIIESTEKFLYHQMFISFQLNKQIKKN